MNRSGLVRRIRLGSTFKIAARALRRNKLRSALTALGIIIGVGEKLGEFYWGPLLGSGIESWLAYVIALIFLLFRPQGLFGEKLIERIKWWEEYTARNRGEMNNNPSPGNKAGGLTTILEKSLGAVAKGGTTNLVAVYEYAQPVTAKGFVYMDTPGYDPVSATGQVAGGANMICFTTGRGSAYGCAPSPSLKLSTNTALWERQEEDIDINCGEIVDGGATVEAIGERFFQMILDTASGKKSKSELHGYGQNEFVPWYLGAVM